MTIDVAAVDLGASSGRVMLGHVSSTEVRVHEAHRFANRPVRLPDGLHWDVLRIYQDMLTGLARAVQSADGDLRSVGIDAWAVDYGLLDPSGALVGTPFCYRDSRTDGVATAVHGVVSEQDHYSVTGLQYLSFNTIYQLAAEGAALDNAATLALLPDLLTYWLTGTQGTELTNASTTGLFDVNAWGWADDLIRRVHLPRTLFTDLRSAGDVVGPPLSHVRHEIGMPSATVVTAVGSHDTASAVAAVPARDERFAYISCGTWSLVGVELEAPVLTEASRAANFTNEAGVDGTVRYLRNVMGLWLLNESVATWQRVGLEGDLATLLAMAAEVPAGGPIFDPDDEAFLPPGDMPSRIAAACERAGQPAPQDQAATVRCILDSLAAAYAQTVHEAGGLSGRDIDVIHIVGGGSHNELLCQLTADACGLPVLAGPAEATALGNILVQARSHGAIAGDLWSLRAAIRTSSPTRKYEPRQHPHR